MSTPAPDVDTIRLTGLSARGRHGVLPSERREGQLFVVDVTLGLGRRGTAVAAVTDSLNDAIDYGKVAASVIAVIEGDPVNLLETLAERVSDAVLAYGRVQEVEVCVHKPQAPLDVAFDDIMVTIHRSAEGAGLSLGGDAASDATLVGAPVERLEPAPAQSSPAPAQSPLSPAQPAPVQPSPSPAPGADGPAAPAQPSPAQAAVEHAAPAESISPGHAAEAAAAEALAPQWQGRQADAPQPEPWSGSAGGGRQGWDDDQGQSDSWGGDADEIPSWGEPAAGAPAWGEPLAGTPAWGVPLGGTPAWGVPQAQPGSESAGQEGPGAAPQASSWGGPASGEPAWDQAAASPAADPLAGAGSAPPQAQAADPAAPLGVAPDAPAPLAGDTPWPAVSATPSAAADGQAPAAGQQPWGPAADIPPTTAVPGGGHQWGEGAPGAAPAAPVQEPPRDLLRERPASPAAVVIALGGNAGGVVPALRTAVSTLRETAGVEVTAVAPLARTAAVVDPGADPQPDFLNTVVLITTTLSPYEVLEVCQGLEAAAGRVRTEPNGPRTLDADIVTYEGVTSTDPELTLPHPRAAQRAFVLVPWAEADPFAELANQSVSSLAEAAPDRDGVRWLALDWIDSDHLPTLPTGQYIAPPEAPSGAGQPAPSGAVADQPAPSGQSGHSAQSAQSGQSAWSGQSAQSAAPAADEDGEEDWSEPLNWNQVVGRRQNGQS